MVVLMAVVVVVVVVVIGGVVERRDLEREAIFWARRASSIWFSVWISPQRHALPWTWMPGSDEFDGTRSSRHSGFRSRLGRD